MIIRIVQNIKYDTTYMFWESSRHKFLNRHLELMPLALQLWIWRRGHANNLFDRIGILIELVHVELHIPRVTLSVTHDNLQLEIAVAKLLC
jgi:hypothetical protein